MGNTERSRNIWDGIQRRCNPDNWNGSLLNYKGCWCCDEWLSYKNFKIWYEENTYNIDGENLDIDKDIIVRGNKLYSPDTCVLVPHGINCIFRKRTHPKFNHPVGVVIDRKTGKYRARCRDGKLILWGTIFHNTPHEAFVEYKELKESLIKKHAELYKPLIPKVVYEAMINYQVSIYD